MVQVSDHPAQILCFGDSNTWGYVPLTVDRYPESVRWTGVMAQALGAGFRIIEEGQNGRTTVWDDPLEGDNKNGLRYLPACLESHHPLDLVIIMLGTNDLKARWNLCARTCSHASWISTRTCTDIRSCRCRSIAPPASPPG